MPKKNLVSTCDICMINELQYIRITFNPQIHFEKAKKF